MKTHLKAALAVFAGFGLGAFMIAGAYAQAVPPHYEGESNKKKPKGVIEPAAEEFTLTWSGGLHHGDCTLFPGATLIVRSDGTATWTAGAFSTSSDDAFGIGLALTDVHDVSLYEWPPFYSGASHAAGYGTGVDDDMCGLVSSPKQPQTNPWMRRLSPAAPPTTVL